MREGGSGRKSRAIIAQEAHQEIEKALLILNRVEVDAVDAEAWAEAGELLREGGRMLVHAGRLAHRVSWRLGFKPVIPEEEDE